MQNHQINMKFDDYEADHFQVDNGLNQGDPFSGICYLIYNRDLLDILERKTGEMILLFVDNTAVITTGKNFTKMHEKLNNIME